MNLSADLLTALSGSLVGFVLGLIGGGGSVLAVPLLVYLVGVPSPHVAIGTSAVAVALSALFNLFGHARAGNVRWPCALVFAGSGVIGASIGSTLGKRFDGQALLILFGVLMVAIAVVMLMRKGDHGDATVRLDRNSAPRLLPQLIGYGMAVGTLSGFFGIGGGFLAVPGLVAATGLPLIKAVGSSLVSVATFGLTTTANYSLSGFIDWHLVGIFVAGGIVGGLAGGRAAIALSKDRQTLARLFAAIVATVGFYVIYRGVLVLVA
jgi:uncharacterized membrane protein YfcA